LPAESVSWDEREACLMKRLDVRKFMELYLESLKWARNLQY
jgi:hypothetical protein